MENIFNFQSSLSSGIFSKNRAIEVFLENPPSPKHLDDMINANNDKHIYFNNLGKVLIKLFLNIPISKEEAILKEHEHLILSKVLFKKKYPIFMNYKGDHACLNKLRTVVLKKKNEDELKFIIKKCIRHMQKEFISNVKSGDALNNPSLEGVTLRDIKKNKDKYFYRFYFMEIAKRDGIPIEKFYHFRSWKNRFCMNIPKSITKESLFLWKKNPTFIDKIVGYIKNDLTKSFYEFNIKKIHTLIGKWEKVIDKSGQNPGIMQIVRSFDGKGSKLPWTVSEVSIAIKHTLQCLK